MDPQEEGLELESIRPGDDDLPVEHAALRDVRAQRRRELREVAVEWLEVPTLDEQLIAVAEDDGAETVPFRLEQPAVALGERRDGLREHRLERGLDGKAHAGTIQPLRRPGGSVVASGI